MQLFSTIKKLIRRIRRSIAQRGLRSAFYNALKLLRSGEFQPPPPHALTREAGHPFDRETGLNTAGYIHGNHLETGHPNDIYSIAYYGSAPSLITQMLDQWLATPGVRPPAECTFIDLGSGKGRVLLLASKMPFKACIGVEINPALNAIAQSNLLRWKQMGNVVSPAEALCQDVTEFQFPATPCVVYLFNPFTGKVLAHLLDNIARAFANRPGELDLLYVNAAYKHLLERHPGFALLWDRPITMSKEDTVVDLSYLANESGSKDFGEAGQEPCSAWRWVGIPAAKEAGLPRSTKQPARMAS